MTIRELMTGGLITVRPETSVQEARDLLTKEKIRHLPVTGPDGALAGIVTDRDIRLNLPSRATSLAAGADGFVEKPIDVRGFLEQVRGILGEGGK